MMENVVYMMSLSKESILNQMSCWEKFAGIKKLAM